MLNVALVGCGKIADSHALQIKRIAGCRMVAACDRELLMARQLQDRFPIAHSFSDVEQMLEATHPDIVHITSSPESHFPLARLCLEAGCHVYVEKPFTLYEHEARTLIELAERKGLKITAGHDDQFRNAARRMRSLVRSGYLGGPPVHMESSYCYELGRSGYAGAILADKQHWVRRLPGQLLQNVISHGVARIAEFFENEAPEVHAFGFVSPYLKQLGETEIVDELRVIISDSNRMTAYFTFSSQMRPSLHQFAIYGPKNGLLLDQDQETLVRLAGARRKSYLEHFVSPLRLAGDYVANVALNVKSFAQSDFHMKAGMKHLIERFYQSITQATAPPIAYREILLTARIMDEIFVQLAAERNLMKTPCLTPSGQHSTWDLVAEAK